MSHDQRIRPSEGNHPTLYVPSGVLISSEHAPDVEWELLVLDDGALVVSMRGRTCFDVRPVSPGSVRLIKR